MFAHVCVERLIKVAAKQQKHLWLCVGEPRGMVHNKIFKSFSMNILSIIIKCLTFLVVLGVVCPAEARAQAEVCQLDVSVQVDEDVVGLDVAVDEAHLVDTLDGQRQLRHIEACKRFGEDAHPDEQAHHVSSGDVVHDEVQAVTVLKGVVETHHPLVVCLR